MNRSITKKRRRKCPLSTPKTAPRLRDILGTTPFIYR
jgi:hypothetical protein